jgi:tetratricopeptide (TPR) repeat protein
VAEAYRVLAGLYVDQHLLDAALALYTQAVELDSRAALADLEELRRRLAAELRQAGVALEHLGRYDLAEALLTQALTHAPDDAATQAALARVVPRRPPQSNAAALAVFELGKLYEKHRNLPKAESYYLEALKAQPNYADARDALNRLIPQVPALSDRFDALLVPALRWLASEISRREMQLDRGGGGGGD